MNNVFVYCEVEGTTVAEVSQELLTKGRKLANQQGVELHAIVAGTGIKGQVENQILPYGVDKLFVFDAEDCSHTLQLLIQTFSSTSSRRRSLRLH